MMKRISITVIYQVENIIPGEMYNPLLELVKLRSHNIDPCFAVSARCIFVHKNHLSPRAFWLSSGKASELGFPELTDFITHPEDP